MPPCLGPCGARSRAAILQRKSEKRDTSPIPGPNRGKGVVHVPAKRLEEGIEELGAELFFFVVGRQEDHAVLVEAVNQTFDGVGGGSHAARE